MRSSQPTQDLEIIESQKGHVMVFLPTEADVTAACETMKLWLMEYEAIRTTEHSLQVSALHGLQMPFKQESAINRFIGQGIIFATSVAETSITVEGLIRGDSWRVQITDEHALFDVRAGSGGTDSLGLVELHYCQVN